MTFMFQNLKEVNNIFCLIPGFSEAFLRSRFYRVLVNGPGDQGSIPGRVIPKTQKMVLDASLLNT